MSSTNRCPRTQCHVGSTKLSQRLRCVPSLLPEPVVRRLSDVEYQTEHFQVLSARCSIMYKLTVVHPSFIVWSVTPSVGTYILAPNPWATSKNGRVIERNLSALATRAAVASCSQRTRARLHIGGCRRFDGSVLIDHELGYSDWFAERSIAGDFSALQFDFLDVFGMQQAAH